MAEYKDHIDQATFEQIEQYLLGQMDTAAHASFEQLMATDPALRAEVDLQQKLQATLEAGTFLAEQATAESAATAPAPVRKLSRRWLYAAAAVLVLAIGATWWLQRAPAYGQLYAKYYQADPGLPVTMGSADSATYVFYDAMISYKEGNFSLAAERWQQLATRTGTTDTLQYYIGMARLNNGQTEESRQLLQPVANNQRSVFKEQAAWYLALSYLSTGDKPAAIRWLRRLPDDERAQQLLAEPGMQ